MTTLPSTLYVWLVPSEDVLDQPGSWRIRKWDTEPFPEANFALSTPSAPSRDEIIEECAMVCDGVVRWHRNPDVVVVIEDVARGIRAIKGKS